MRKFWIITVMIMVATAVVLASCGHWGGKTQKHPTDLGSGGDGPVDDGGLRGIALLESLDTPAELPYGISHLPKDSVGIDLQDIVGSSNVLSNPENYISPPRSYVADFPDDFRSVGHNMMISDGEFTNTTSSIYNRIIVELEFDSDYEFGLAVLAELELIEQKLPLSSTRDEDGQSEFERAYDALILFYQVGKNLPEGWPEVTMDSGKVEQANQSVPQDLIEKMQNSAE